MMFSLHINQCHFSFLKIKTYHFFILNLPKVPITQRIKSQTIPGPKGPYLTNSGYVLGSFPITVTITCYTPVYYFSNELSPFSSQDHFICSFLYVECLSLDLCMFHLLISLKSLFPTCHLLLSYSNQQIHPPPLILFWCYIVLQHFITN